MDEEGEVQLVIMNVESYQNLLIGKLQRQVKDVEDINQEIVKAQLFEETEDFKVAKKTAQPVVGQRQPDLREEVIDPSFDFEGPKTEIDDL